MSKISAEFLYKVILEPCSGEHSIADPLHQMGYEVITNDIQNGSEYQLDYLDQNKLNDFPYIITNPPFSYWDEFVMKAKTHCRKFMMIGRLNFFGTISRQELGIWKNLKAVYVFNRYVDYQTPIRDDGLFHVGSICSGWFLWDMNYSGLPTIEVLDVQQWAKLGAFNRYDYSDIIVSES